MNRHIPDFRDDEFTWQCPNGHWNKDDERWCRTCREPSPIEEAHELLKKLAREHPRDEGA